VKLEEQVPRNALVWIIATQFALLLPHLGRLPAWVLLLYLGTALWRIMVFRGRWSFPHSYLKIALTLACCAGVASSYGTLIGLEPTVALLLIAYALKLLELAIRRDAYILVFIAYFTALTEFLFTQELLITLYMLFAVVLNTTSLVALHQPGQDRFNPGSFRRAAAMMAQSFPLMILLFFVFPRIGPLWNVPLKSTAAQSGMSDFMRPGDVANLSLSDDVAFRAQFEGEIPPRRELYWRGLVLSRLEQGAWRSLRWQDVPGDKRRAQVPELTGEFVDYNIIMEPTQQNWLYAIPYATTSDRGIMAINDYRLLSPVEVQDQKRYRVRSWLEVPLEPQLGDWRRRIETMLPAAGNPRTRELAVRMFEDAGGDPGRYADSVLQMFREQAYFYTLRPPVLGGDRVDQFLFDTHRGFCEHYAAAFTWLMRAVGVPTRVVAGYQGGEINPVNGTVIVHQFDAHAWNEIWLEDRGWVRIDPTAAIAPDRIEFGLEEALAEEGSFLSETPLSPLRYRDIDWINAMRLQLDAFNYSWQVFVLGFNREEQYDLLNRLLGNISRNQLAAGVIALWVVLLLPVAFTMLWQSRGPRLDAATRAYLEFCTRLRRSGLERHRHEAPSDYALRVIGARPALSAEVNAITANYESLAYGVESDPGVLAELKRRVKNFRC
jgi:transglutaminase-like putative cysteine protease